MTILRRTFLYLSAGAAALPFSTRLAKTQAYPTRPVRIVVGFPAGGNTDIAARIVAQWLSERFGQQFIVENRPGAAANIATEAVVHSSADGYTLLATSSTNTINAALYKDLKFNFLNDIVMVAGIARSPLVLEVHPSLPARTVPEFIAQVKANPGKINLASFGTGTVSHVTGELFKIAAGINMVHVPYRGSAPMVTDLLGGHVTAAFDNLPASIEYIRAGGLRALAVTTKSRSEALPDIPTMDEYLPGFEISAWAGIGAPKNTPPAIVDTLNREINLGLADPVIKERLANLGAAPFISTPAELANFVMEQTEERARIVQAAKIKPE
ncbi:MFS transporter [Bradyrhizobium japonicum]|uniref:MFS transporter n=1 Tax=Bradyrhizobium japonicum TaxID=375 RepID=A0A0A3YQW7_BRAJP|nr:tripartite tricarboxylate transporter substrate binding protein [Bradyrhizobium japonicum]KGT76053.1 MFS transporter [Bradyrhizobium japonicum]